MDVRHLRLILQVERNLEENNLLISIYWFDINTVDFNIVEYSSIDQFRKKCQ